MTDETNTPFTLQNEIPGRSRPRLTFSAIPDHPDLLSPSSHERKAALMNGESVRYRNGGSRRVCVPREGSRRVCVPRLTGGRSCHGRVKMVAFMQERDGLIVVEVEGADGEQRCALEDGPHLHLSFEKGWCLEKAGRDEIVEMARAFTTQLWELNIETHPSYMASLIRQLGRNREKSSLADFFKEDPGTFPTDFSSVVWHPSAGHDFSPLVAYARGYLEGKEALSDLTPATLHIMTCLAACEEQLMTLLKSEERVLFEDHRTRMRIVDYQMLELRNEGLWRRPSPRHFNHSGRETLFREHSSDGFMAWVEIFCKDTGYREEVPLLYLLGENIATYKEFVRSGLFQIRHIKATCEGLAFGGCRRSLIDYICQNERGLDTLESVWLRRGAAEHRFRKLSDRWQIEVGKMPLAFSGEIVRVSRKEVSHA